jgi:predicted dithiol-disulfide oxidoreductase (DUF899 family)
MAKKDKKKKKKVNSKKLEKKYGRLEKELGKIRKKMLKVQSKLGKKEVQDYTLKDSGGSDVKLSQLFGDKKDLVLIHNMGKACRYCTLWADGFNGNFYFIQKLAGFALVSPDTPEVQKSFAAERGWKFPMYSGAGSAFIKDMGYQDKKGGYLPGASVFHKNDDGSITRVSKTFFGPGDFYCSVWHFLDMVPGKEEEIKKL